MTSDLRAAHAQAFRAARTAQALSQSAAAAALGVPLQSLQAWEQARRSIPDAIRAWVVKKWGADPALTAEACPHCGRGW